MIADRHDPETAEWVPLSQLEAQIAATPAGPPRASRPASRWRMPVLGALGLVALAVLLHSVGGPSGSAGRHVGFVGPVSTPTPAPTIAEAAAAAKVKAEEAHARAKAEAKARARRAAVRRRRAAELRARKRRAAARRRR